MKYCWLFIILVFLFSCDKNQDQAKPDEKVNSLFSVVKEHLSVKPVKPIYAAEIEDWEELKAVDNFLGRFKKVSANEILSNALELKGLAKNLKDKKKPNLFNIASCKARINIFYNETLRLADMTTIPAITATEVHQQTEKIIDAFSAVNAKVNTIFSKKRFEDEIGIDIKFIGLDSTKIDSVTRKSLSTDLKIK
ncbi:hypothetical protein [Polaribacter sp. R77954]|uniref:hypothetical protein n=1 Tax=Polaribacter sp. R77954 TaxID=3093870 RepID=UPI0037C6A399